MQTLSLGPRRARQAEQPRAASTAYIVQIYGPDLGRRLPLTGDEPLRIGRSVTSDIAIDQESVSRNHAEVRREGNAWFVHDLSSTNGTYVNERRVSVQQLQDGDRFQVGQCLFKFLTGSNVEAAYHEEIYRLMTVDGLTGLFNKRFFNDAIARELNRARRYRRHLSLVMVDIDHFKTINDRYGHLAGDSVLRQVALIIREHLRQEDIVARVGGEEFAVLLPEIGRGGANAAAEKIRSLVESSTFLHGPERLQCTISLGVATAGERTEAAADLYILADRMLYAAKAAGRNRIRVA